MIKYNMNYCLVNSVLTVILYIVLYIIIDNISGGRSTHAFSIKTTL